jgi:hypothetical protein
MRFRKPGLTHRFLVLGLGAAAPAALVLGLLVPGAVRATVVAGTTAGPLMTWEAVRSPVAGCRACPFRSITAL